MPCNSTGPGSSNDPGLSPAESSLAPESVRRAADDGGPAFPSIVGYGLASHPVNSHHPYGYGGPHAPYAQEVAGYAAPLSAPGMSLRDWFAGQALAGVLAANAEVDLRMVPPVRAVAITAYAMADAMLAARKGPAA